jgi:hypothetical protein
MELAGTGQEQAAGGDRVLCAIAQKGTRTLEEKMDLEFARAVGMIATMPGQPVTAREAIHKDRVFNRHTQEYTEKSRKYQF